MKLLALRRSSQLFFASKFELKSLGYVPKRFLTKSIETIQNTFEVSKSSVHTYLSIYCLGVLLITTGFAFRSTTDWLLFFFFFNSGREPFFFGVGSSLVVVGTLARAAVKIASVSGRRITFFLGKVASPRRCRGRRCKGVPRAASSTN